jgi:hypothetical protein
LAREQRVIRHDAYGVPDRASSLGLHPALVPPQPTIDIIARWERVDPRLIEPVVATDPTGDELHLDVVSSEFAESNQRADMDLRPDLDLLAAERFNVLH